MENNSVQKISIVIPVYNEEKNLPLLYSRLIEIFKGKPQYDLELILVNDGSKDHSWTEIEKLAHADKRVRGINFSRNFGHQSALEAGLKMANGDATVMMDADLQHPPSVILELIEKWQEGYDIVNTKRLKTENESWLKKLTSKMFYKVINWISDIHIEPGSADFRLVNKKALNALNSLTEKDKFYRGLVNWIGFRSTFVSYTAHDRQYGVSSYSLGKMLSLAHIGITSFSMLPMKIIIAIGSLMFFGGSFLMVIMIYVRWFVNIGFFSGNAILTAFIILSNGLIIVTIGIISIYQINIFKETKDRPTYIVKDIINYE
jgi:dolichol-phosphate mannosyltransferase